MHYVKRALYSALARTPHLHFTPFRYIRPFLPPILVFFFSSRPSFREYIAIEVKYKANLRGPADFAGILLVTPAITFINLPRWDGDGGTTEQRRRTARRLASGLRSLGKRKIPEQGSALTDHLPRDLCRRNSEYKQ